MNDQTYVQGFDKRDAYGAAATKTKYTKFHEPIEIFTKKLDIIKAIFKDKGINIKLEEEDYSSYGNNIKYMNPLALILGKYIITNNEIDCDALVTAMHYSTYSEFKDFKVFESDIIRYARFILKNKNL